jgi:hypothetical protein
MPWYYQNVGLEGFLMDCNVKIKQQLSHCTNIIENIPLVTQQIRKFISHIFLVSFISNLPLSDTPRFILCFLLGESPPVNHPEESMRHLEHGKSLKSRKQAK